MQCKLFARILEKINPNYPILGGCQTEEKLRERN